MPTPAGSWINTDFNGFLEPDLLCLAHSETVQDESRRAVRLREGMIVTAFDFDADDEGKLDRILVTGSVERSPGYAKCRGSLWCVRVDSAGIQRESELEGGSSNESL